MYLMIPRFQFDCEIHLSPFFEGDVSANDLISRFIGNSDHRRFLNSDRGRQAGFDLAKRVFGIGDEESAKDAEE